MSVSPGASPGSSSAALGGASPLPGQGEGTASPSVRGGHELFVPEREPGMKSGAGTKAELRAAAAARGPCSEPLAAVKINGFTAGCCRQGRGLGELGGSPRAAVSQGGPATSSPCGTRGPGGPLLPKVFG